MGRTQAPLHERNIDEVFSVTNKISMHACKSAGEQVALVTKGQVASDTDVSLLISNVGVLGKV